MATSNDRLLVVVLTEFLTPVPDIRPRHRVFPGDPAQVSQARRFTRSALGDCPAADDAALLTSELVTNSILHSRSANGGTIHVLIAHHCPGTLRVAVLDNGATTEPTLASTGHLSSSGRGLTLVQHIAARWGHHGNDHARAVWFEIHCP